ncbi:MAG: TetR/AcrR family transcriptional regulator [Marmoricola sp.]
MSTPSATAPGRPRSERARLAILDAAADLLAEGGLGSATIEAIAARAGVSKVTIYRWWPSRGAVAVDAFFHRHEATIQFEDTGDIADDLVGQVEALIAAFRGGPGRIMAELIGAAQLDPGMGQAVRDRWVIPRRTTTKAVLKRAVERGQVRAGVDPDVVLDQIYGAVYFRVMIGHQALRKGLARELVSNVLDGVRP